MNKRSKLQIFPLAIFAAYAAATLVTVLSHEPWRDESQYWIITRSLSLRQLISEMPYQGHGILWYLVVAPLSRSGLPYVSYPILHWLVALASLSLFLWRAPFPTFTKLLAAFSYYLFWQYNIDARHYAMSILLLFSLAVCYPTRFSHPLRFALLLFLMFNNDVLLFPIGTAVLGLWAWETVRERHSERRLLACLAMAALGLISGAWIAGLIAPPPDSGVGTLAFEPQGFKPAVVLNGLVSMFFTGSGPVSLLAAPAAAILLILLYSLASRPKALTVCLLQLAGLFAITGMRGASSERHFGIVLMGVLFCLWIAHDEQDRAFPKWLKLPYSGFATRYRNAIVVLNVSFVASMGQGWVLHKMDWNYDYSGCTKMAHFIKENHLEDLPIAADRYPILQSMGAYFPDKQFWYAGVKKWVTFAHADAAHFYALAHPSYSEALARMDAEFPPSQPLLVLLDSPIDPSLQWKYRLRYKVDSSVMTDERFYLYERRSPIESQ